jgi:prepilin-type processing-associated H-X9-DG protein
MIQCGDRNIGDGGTAAPTGGSLDFGYSPGAAILTGNLKAFGTNVPATGANTSAAWTDKMHTKSGGNILFADGHVEGLSSAKLRDAFKVTGDTTTPTANVILFP